MLAKINGLKAGYAFLKVGTFQYKLIRQVDLSKSDKELCAEFGIY
jgi:hypothetical protein